MSLISVNNFVAPLRQRFHLITIVLITVVFATLRLSGAAIEVHKDGESRRQALVPTTIAGTAPSASLRRESPANQEVLQALREQQNAEPRRDYPLRVTQSAPGDLIEDVMRPAEVPIARNRVEDETAAQRRDNGKGSLSDIEKQLGLK
jgi:hypothetical protein